MNGVPLAGTEVCFRIQALIKDIEPEIAFKCHIDPELRKSWDLKMSDLKIIEQNDKETIKYYVVKSNIPFVADRDVVVRQQEAINFPTEGTYSYAFTSTTHSQYPENQKYVRTSNHFTAYKFSPAPEVNGTWMEWI